MTKISGNILNSTGHHLFPKLPDRSQFARQTAKPWVIKQQMHQHLIKLLGADTADIHLAHGFPMNVCVTTYEFAA